jgi:AraC family transcriptional regulator
MASKRSPALQREDMGLRRATADDYERRLVRAERLLEERRDEPVRIVDLADAASLALHHFHRVFYAQRGETVADRVQRLHLERAAPSSRIEAWRKPASAPPAVPIDVRTFAPLPVVFIRHHGSYESVGKTWGRLLDRLGAAQGRAGSFALYGICRDDPDVIPEEALRFDACAAVAGIAAELDVTELPGGTYAVGLHAGPYDRLHETYLDVIGRWFPSSGFDLAPEPVIEHYLNDPSCTDAEDLLTEVRVRIAD